MTKDNIEINNAISFSERKEGEDDHGEYVIPYESNRKQGINGIEIGNYKAYTMTVDFGDTRGLKFLIDTNSMPTEKQRKNLKEQMGIVIRTREEDEDINGKHSK